jgi:hypothetical protein
VSATALHLHETASLGPRACRLAGVGSEHARLVRLVLLAYTRWPGQPRQSPWPSNRTLASRTRLDERQVERALAVLRAAQVIEVRVGHRPGARRSVGRLIDVGLHAPCKALAPEGIDVGHLWTLARAKRSRPAALVTAMFGAWMLACDHAGGPIDDWAELGCTASDWRRFVGHADNASWTKRLRELDELGLIRREGRTIFVSPTRAWFVLAVDHAGTKLVGKITGRRQDQPEQAQAEDNDAPGAMASLPKLPEGKMQRVGWLQFDAELRLTGTSPPPNLLARGQGPPP